MKNNRTRNLSQDDSIEKTILRMLGVFDFSHSLLRKSEADGGDAAPRPRQHGPGSRVGSNRSPFANAHIADSERHVSLCQQKGR